MSNLKVDAEKNGVHLDLNDIEAVFGSPNLPKNGVKPDTHVVANEKTNGGVHNTQGSDPNSVQPLLEPDKGPPKPPLAGAEIDDLDGPHPAGAPYPGIDDGLLEPEDKFPGEGDSVDKGDGLDPAGLPHEGEGEGTDDGKWWPSTDVADHPYGFDSVNGLGPRFGIDGRPISPPPESIDVNTYQQKKNLAQGMMDLALLSANANQLRYVLESFNDHPYFYPSIIFISMSIILQVAVGVGLIMNSRYNVHDKKEICKADRINNMTVLGVFVVTVVNVFITSFGVATRSGAGTVPSNVQQAG